VLRKRILIVLGVLAAAAVCLVVASRALAGHDLAPVGVADRLALAWRWLLVPGLCLLAGVGMTANQRFLRADAIDGGRPAGAGFFEINLRYNTNTAEQAVLAAVAWTGLALELPPGALGLIPALLQTVWYGPVYATGQSVVSPASRATTAAILLFVLNLIGLGLGPISVGALNDLLAGPVFGLGQAEGVRWALIASSCVVLVSGALFWWARDTVVQDIVS